MILLGLSPTPKTVDPSLFDMVSDNTKDISYDFVIDLTGVKLIRDPRPYLSSEFAGVYGDFVDSEGIFRLSTLFPYKYDAYPGMIWRKDIFEQYAGIIVETLPFKYVPESLVEILPFS
jgi:hypothetical protein